MDPVLAKAAADDLSAFFDVSLDMLCIRDMHGCFVKASPSWERSLGWSMAELVGTPMLSLIHPEDIEPSRAQMGRADHDGEIVGFVNRYRHKDGRYRYLEWRARRMGEFVFGVARDVTDRLAMEAEMQTAAEAAEAANRAKSDFLANMSHEIRTPLNGVIGLVDALAGTALRADQREMVELIRTAGGALERLLSDILDMSKIEAGLVRVESRPFDLVEILTVAADTFRARAEQKGLAFSLEVASGVEGLYLGDSTRLGQVFSNLLSNAVKFTASGAVRAAIRAEAADEGEAVPVVIEIEDTGVGFDETQGEALFQRFSQADTTITRRFGGTGLGLSICRSLVEMMGGRIEARSTPGEGSTFRVVLPLRRAGGADASESPTPQPFALEGVLRVLLAEDHPVNQKVVQYILEPLGAHLTVVEDGARALEALAAGTFDLVLMDMQMPVMDGLAATRALRKREAEAGFPPTPVIMLSANAMLQHRAQSHEAGADLHLAKPVSAAGLIGAVREAMSRRGRGPGA
jgi:two-component system, sensor histidine kinase